MWLTPLLFPAAAMAITLDLSSTQSISSAAGTAAYNMMTYYTGNQTGQVPGLLPGSLSCDPKVTGTYCWWEAGAMWGSLINYWQYTNDSTYNSIVSESIQFQRGPEDNFNPPNQSRSMGVDDQLFWAFSALDAVESNSPRLEATIHRGWLSHRACTISRPLSGIPRLVVADSDGRSIHSMLDITSKSQSLMAATSSSQQDWLISQGTRATLTGR